MEEQKTEETVGEETRGETGGGGGEGREIGVEEDKGEWSGDVNKGEKTRRLKE